MKLGLSSRIILLLGFCFLHIQLSFSYSLVGNVLTDLTANDSRIQTDVDSWYLSSYYPGTSAKIYVCAGTYLLGGYKILGGSRNEYFERTYTGLPSSHNLIEFEFLFYPIDSWDGADGGIGGGLDRFYLQFDGVQYDGWRFSIFTIVPQQICGSTQWKEHPPVQAYMKIPHTGSNLDLKFISYLDEDTENESFGFRDIKMTFTTVANPEYSLCGRAEGAVALQDKICPCTEARTYMDPPNSGRCFDCGLRYTFWNGTCADCPLPLKKRVQDGQNYCDYKCESYEYLHFNGTCLTYCPSPFTVKIEGDVIQKKFCSIDCQDHEFFYWNGLCLPQCPSPYNIRYDGPYKICSLPCNNLISYYYPDSRKCSHECPSSSHMINNNEIYPQCVPIPTSSAADTFVAMFLEAPQSGTPTIVKAVKAMQYLKYLDIKLPPRLQRFGMSQGRSATAMGSGARLLSENLPSVFVKHNFQSSFVENFLDTLIFVGSAFAGAIMLDICEKVAKATQFGPLEIIFMRLRVLTKWNLVLMTLAKNIDEIILAASVEFRTLQLTSSSSFLDYFNFVLCIVFLVLASGLLVFNFGLVKEKLQKTKTSVVPEDCSRHKTELEFNNKWQDFQVLFRGFSDNHYLNAYFFLIYTIRIGFPMIITVWAVSKPLIVIISQVAANVLILLLMLKMKPFKKRINLVQLVLYEFVVFLMNIGMLVLVIFSIYDVDNDDASAVLGDIIIICNEILNILAIVFCLIKIVQEFYVIRRLQKTHPEEGIKGKTRYIQLLGLVFQQVNMGFEELIEEDPGSNSKNPKEITEKDQELDLPKIIYRKNPSDVPKAPFIQGLTDREQLTSGENTRRNRFNMAKKIPDLALEIQNQELHHLNNNYSPIACSDVLLLEALETEVRYEKQDPYTCLVQDLDPSPPAKQRNIKKKLGNWYTRQDHQEQENQKVE